MAQPVGSLHGETARRELDITPFECNDLPQPWSRITACQHHQVRVLPSLASDGQESLVLIEVVEPHPLLGSAGVVAQRPWIPADTVAARPVWQRAVQNAVATGQGRRLPSAKSCGN